MSVQEFHLPAKASKRFPDNRVPNTTRRRGSQELFSFISRNFLDCVKIGREDNGPSVVSWSSGIPKRLVRGRIVYRMRLQYAFTRTCFGVILGSAGKGSACEQAHLLLVDGEIQL